jgi:nucleotide-binding universal stress UspA family protein
MTSTTSTEIHGGIVVGHDGSQAATRATRWAATMAGRLGLALHVVRAWTLQSAPRPASATGGYVPPLADFEQAVCDQLTAEIAALALPPDVPVSVHAPHGPPSRQLLEAAKGADLLVVGSRGVGGFRSLLLGSTADQVARHATCPVTIVPATAADRSGRAGPRSSGRART